MDLYWYPSSNKSAKKLATSLIGPEMEFLSRFAHQRAHLLKEELYDLMDLSLHEDRTRSVATGVLLKFATLAPTYIRIPDTTHMANWGIMSGTLF